MNQILNLPPTPGMALSESPFFPVRDSIKSRAKRRRQFNMEANVNLFTGVPSGFYSHRPMSSALSFAPSLVENTIDEGNGKVDRTIEQVVDEERYIDEGKKDAPLTPEQTTDIVNNIPRMSAWDRFKYAAAFAGAAGGTVYGVYKNVEELLNLMGGDGARQQPDQLLATSELGRQLGGFYVSRDFEHEISTQDDSPSLLSTQEAENIIDRQIINARQDSTPTSSGTPTIEFGQRRSSDPGDFVQTPLPRNNTEETKTSRFVTPQKPHKSRHNRRDGHTLYIVSPRRQWGEPVSGRPVRQRNTTQRTTTTPNGTMQFGDERQPGRSF